MRNIPVIVFLLTLLLLTISARERNYVIKKCSCEWYQIQEEDGSCLNHNTTYIHEWDSDTLIGTDVHLSEVPNVVVTPLVCPSNYQKVILRGIALLSTEGQLIPSSEPQTYNYCIENFITADGSPGQLYEFCVTYDPFPLCCPPNETMNDLGECGEPYNLIQISYDYVVRNVHCSNENPAHDPVSMEDNLVTLKSIFGYYGESRNNNSCLVSHIRDQEVFYYKKYCECEGLTCIEACCGPTDSFNIDTNSCEPTADLYDPSNLEFPEKNIKSISRSMVCNESFILDFSDNHHIVLADGSLSSEVGQVLPIHSFCLGLITKENITLSTGLGCVIDKLESVCMWRFTIIHVFLIISSIFIVITIVVYLSVKDLRDRTGGACLISQLLAMLISQVNLIVIQRNQEKFSPGGCLAAGVIEVIFVLASFFWLNVMCFDMWTTFRELKPFSQKLLNIKLFLKYSLYAWGVPLLIGMTVLAVELFDRYPRPTFTIYDGCFFTSSADDIIAQWIYLYSIIVLILLVNLFFFLQVIFKLFVIQKEQKKFLGNNSRKTGSHTNPDNENIRLYAKLFIIMGVPWLIEAFTSFGTSYHECYIWIFDIINLLRGVFIFIIFVLKKSTRAKVMQTWTLATPSTEVSNSDQSRKTSTISLSSWLPSRKTSTSPPMKPIHEDIKQ